MDFWERLGIVREEVSECSQVLQVWQTYMHYRYLSREELCSLRKCVAADCWWRLGPQALAHALETAQVENRRAQARKVMIEKRKEDAERQAAALEQQEEQDRIMQERISAAAEEERRKQERWACGPDPPTLSFIHFSIGCRVLGFMF